MDDIRKEFWGDLMADMYTVNSAVYLANQRLESIISTNGWKAHRSILSNPQTGTYTPHSDIAFETKSAVKQTLQVDTFEYAAEDIDITEKSQTPYDLLSHSLQSIRKGLLNRVEQKYLSEVVNAGQSISGAPVSVSSTNILDILEEAEGKLGAFDATYETAMRALVLGPRTVAKLRRSKSDRETKLGDDTLENGVIGPWQGWTVVQNNNLPWSATLTLATQPTDGDTVTISGVTFTFKTVLGTTAGNVLIGANAAAARTNLKSAIEGTAGAGSTYVQLANRNKFVIRRKRKVTVTIASNDMQMAGFGDISVSETLTAAADIWSVQKVKACFMIRGAIDLVVQFMDLKVADKEKGFAELPKGIIGIGTKTFDDGKDLMVLLDQDASGF
jgi:hypothetical protein